MKSKGTLTQLCSLPQGQLDTLIYDTMQVVSDVCDRAKLLKLRGARIGLVKLAYNMIREGEHIFIKTDKDGGFVATETSEILMARLRVMSTDKYSVCNRRTCINDSMLYEYCGICDDIGKIQDGVVCENLI